MLQEGDGKRDVCLSRGIGNVEKGQDGIVGTPAVPVAGVAGRRMPAYAKKFDGDVKQPPEFVTQPEEEAPQTRTWAILKTDVPPMVHRQDARVAGLLPKVHHTRIHTRKSAD